MSGERDTRDVVAADVQTTSLTPTPLPPVAPAAHRLTVAPHRAPRRRRLPVVRWLVMIAGVVGLAVAIALAWAPTPATVELAPVRVGPLEVTVNEDGRARIRDRYVLSSPVAGIVARTSLRPGDAVRRGDVVGRVTALASPLLDPRARSETEARQSAALAGVRQAATAVTRAREAYTFAQREAERQRVLLRAGATAAQTAEQAELAERTRAEEMASAEFGLRVAESELQLVRVALRRLDPALAQRTEAFEIRAPADGEVLRVTQESEGAVPAGAPLLEIGDPRALEVVVDVLTADAVDIKPGAPVRIERWGGDAELSGRVHRVEPSAFTRLSSLGIEEQRVNVIVDLDSGPPGGPRLSDGYRVEAKIIVWQRNHVLQIPAGAVFRSGDGWAAYVLDGGRARLRPLQIGRRNASSAQVLGGLEAGEQVLVYPSDDVTDGARVAPR